MRAYLVVGIAVVLALAGAAAWLVDVGYRNGKAECQREAARTRAQIEARWIRDADVIAEQAAAQDDAIAAIDQADAGSAVCLDAGSVQRLRAIR